MIRSVKLVLFFLVLGNSLFARGVNQWSHPERKNKILFSGTLLAISANTLPQGRWTYENFFQVTKIYGIYNRDSKLIRDRDITQYGVLPLLRFGIFDFLDFSIITSINHARTDKANASSFGDTIWLLGLQLFNAKKDKWWVPDTKLLVGASIPTGKFDGLNPDLFGGDITGTGSFETNIILSMAKVYPINKCHALRFNPNLYLIIPQPTRFTSFSLFGGLADTRGRVKPGIKYAFDFPIEYNFTNHIIFGLDIFYLHRNSVDFHSSAVEEPFTGFPSSENLSLAPCLEFTPNENVGIEIGCWFSVNGRNSAAFATTIIFTWVYF